MGNLHSEQHLSNDLVVNTLRNISKEQAIGYSKIKKIFSEGDAGIAKTIGSPAINVDLKNIYKALECGDITFSINI